MKKAYGAARKESTNTWAAKRKKSSDVKIVQKRRKAIQARARPLFSGSCPGGMPKCRLNTFEKQNASASHARSAAAEMSRSSRRKIASAAAREAVPTARENKSRPRKSRIFPEARAIREGGNAHARREGSIARNVEAYRLPARRPRAELVEASRRYQREGVLARENFTDSDDSRTPPSTMYIARWKSAPDLDWQ